MAVVRVRTGKTCLAEAKNVLQYHFQSFETPSANAMQFLT